MNFPPKFTHHSTSDLWKPEVDSSKQRKNGSRRNDIMKMRDDVIGIVQVQIAKIKAQWKSGETADAEHRQKSHHKEHGGVKSDRATPQRKKHAGQNDH